MNYTGETVKTLLELCQRSRSYHGREHTMRYGGVYKKLS